LVSSEGGDVVNTREEQGGDITVIQVLRLSTLKKHATEYDKNTSLAMRRAEITP
jgi:hypothetical protein